MPAWWFSAATHIYYTHGHLVNGDKKFKVELKISHLQNVLKKNKERY